MPEICGHEKTRDHLHEGVKAGRKLQGHARLFSLILSVARQLPTSHDAGLDEHEKQVFWLRGRSTCLTFPSITGQWSLRRSLLVTAGLYHTGFTPVFLFSYDFHHRHFSRLNTTNGVRFKELHNK